MRSSIVALTLAISICAIASGQETVMQARAQGPVEIILDLKNHLALVPEGTVIPAGLRVGGASVVRRAARVGERAPLSSDGMRRSPAERTEPAAFVFAYAPDSAFAPYRANRRPSRTKPLDTCFGPYYVYASDPGCGGCQVTLVESVCYSTGFPNYTETYFADSYPAMQAEFEYATIYSDDNYYSCYQQDFWSSASVGCYSGDTRHNTSPNIGTTVHIEGFAEFLSGGNLYDVSATLTVYLYSVHN